MTVMESLTDDERALVDLARSWASIDADRSTCRVVRTVNADASRRFAWRAGELDAAATAIESGEEIAPNGRAVLTDMIDEALTSHRRSLASPHFVGGQQARVRLTRHVALLERLHARVLGTEVMDQPSLFPAGPNPDPQSRDGMHRSDGLGRTL